MEEEDLKIEESDMNFGNDDESMPEDSEEA
jgi:hypothetical protein